MKNEKPIERDLPVINLGGVPGADFYVDALENVLTDTLDNLNKIHVSEMMAFENHYEFIYDNVQRTAKLKNWNEVEKGDERYTKVRLRPLGAYDLEGAKLYLKDHPGEMSCSFKTGEPGFYFDSERKLGLFDYELLKMMRKIGDSQSTDLPPNVHFISQRSISEQIIKPEVNKRKIRSEVKKGRKL